MRLTRLIAPAALVLALPAFSADTRAVSTYTIDATHSEVGFRVRHLVSKTSGRFTKLTGTITVDEKDFSKSTVQVSIDASSINTDDASRDKHLRSADFFDVEKYPVITFKSTAVKDLGNGRLEVTGDFTMHGVTKRITFPITNFGAKAGMKPGTTVAGFGDGTLTINRQDYGVSYGKGMLGDEVQITLDVEATK